MAWLKFTSDYDYKPKQAVTVAYKAGWKGNVPSRCATLAVADGKAIRLKTPNKGEEPVEDGSEA